MPWWPWKSNSGGVVSPPRVAPPSSPPGPPYNYDGGDGEGDGSDDEEPFHLRWSCRRELKDAEGVSIDDSGEVQSCHACHACWALITPQWRLMLGLIFRRVVAGGFGVADLIEQALKEWPGIRPSRN